MSDASLSSPPRRRPAGAAAHRPQVTIALHRALLLEWARVGYAALSLETVARRAGAGKAALYRRWPSKLAMVSDALADPARTIGHGPDRGSLAADLDDSVRHLRRLMRHPPTRRILLDLHAEMARSPELATLVRERIEAPWRGRLAQIVERAIIRRELPPGTDPAPLAERIMGPLYWRLIVTGGRADDAWLDALTTTALAATALAATARA